MSQEPREEPRRVRCVINGELEVVGLFGKKAKKARASRGLS